MFKTSLAVFLTLVLLESISVASPHKEAPRDQTETVEDQPVDPALLNGVAITPVPVNPKAVDEYSRAFSKENYFYKHKKAITAHAGTFYGFEDSSGNGDTFNSLIGVSYLFPWKGPTKTEAGVDLTFIGHGFVTVMQRRIHNENSSFRPYFRYGVMLNIDPDDKLAAVSDWKTYLGRVGIGFEDTGTPSQSLRIEFDVAAGAQDLMALFSVGYVWGI